MYKQKYSPCYNCYKHYKGSSIDICFASFPCLHLAQQYVVFYCSNYDVDDSRLIRYFIKRESVAKFENF